MQCPTLRIQRRVLERYGRNVFEISPNFLRVIFKYEQSFDVEPVEGLVENQRRILSLITENPRISKREMAEKTGISTTAIDKNISTLKNKGILTRIGSDKGGHWSIVIVGE